MKETQWIDAVATYRGVRQGDQTAADISGHLLYTRALGGRT